MNWVSAFRSVEERHSAHSNLKTSVIMQSKKAHIAGGPVTMGSEAAILATDQFEARR